MRVDGEDLRATLGAHGLGAAAIGQFERLLRALESEPDPPTTVREPANALARHIADSLAALEVEALREAGRIVDVGSGAGFPGLALAIALPGASVDLVESARRKCAVMERLIAAAAITNARVVHARAEGWGTAEGRESYDVATARALAPLPVVVEYAAPLLRLRGVLIVWRGARDAAEERAGGMAAERVGLAPSEPVAVSPFPGSHSRHLHVFAKRAPTPPEIPRRPGVALKRPLA